MSEKSKIFWRSKDGKLAPAHAKFSLLSFDGQKKIELFDPIYDIPSPLHKIKILNRTDLPNRETWRSVVQQALKAIHEGKFQKVVLARKTTLTLSKKIDPFAIASSLKTEGASQFCIEFPDKSAFLGVSPERLFHRKGRFIFTEAVAGTRKREDHLSAELLSSEKDLREFNFVKNYIHDVMLPCTSHFSFDSITIHRTANVQHLKCQGFGLLLPEISDHQLLSILHPTPALCGFPKKNTSQWLKDNEPFPRNFYGGIIGWKTDEESDWTVAIRSCEIENQNVHLYAGVGIVAGSDPDLEWEELEAKISLYKDVFECIH